MRPGGLLDRFPLHLFAGAHPVIVVFDRADLGRLELFALGASGAVVIVVSPDEDVLRRTKESIAGLTNGRVHLVRADPGSVPIADGTVSLVVAGGGRSCDPKAGSVRRILSTRGHAVEFSHVSDSDWGSETPDHDADHETFYVRPGRGGRYFVTREWVPRSWPLGQVSHGRLDSVRIAVDLWASRVGVRALCDSVRLRVWGPGASGAGVVQRLSGARRCDFGMFVKAGSSAVLLGAGPSGGIAKFPLGERALGDMEHHVKNLEALRSQVDSSVASLLPRVEQRGRSDGQAFWVEGRVEGSAATARSGDPRATESAVQFLIDLHQSTRKQTIMGSRHFSEFIEPLVVDVQRAAVDVDPGCDLGPVGAGIWSRVGGRTIPMVRTHGDFWPANILVSEQGAVTGVLDWDLSIDRGWPMLDLLHLVAFGRKWQATWMFGNVITRRLMPRRLARWEGRLVDRYVQALGLSDDLWPAFVALYWLGRAARFGRGFGPRWIARNVVKPLPRILDALDTGGTRSPLWPGLPSEIHRGETRPLV